MMFEWYDQVHRDVRLAGRRALRHTTFTGIVVLCVALGIASTTAVLSVLHPVLLRQVAFEDPKELVQLAAFTQNRASPDERYYPSWFVIDALDRERTVLEGVGGFYQRDFSLTEGDGDPERTPGAETLPGSLAVLGIHPIAGRALTQEDVALGRRVALVTEGFATQRYSSVGGALGRVVALDGQPHEIVGVLPGEVRLATRPEVFAVHQPDDYTRTEHLGLGVFLAIGRLPDGAEIADAAPDIAAMSRALKEAEPVFFGNYDFDFMGLQDFLVGDFQRPLFALLASALFVLILASVNVANLVMARAQGEVWERGLRAALGARCARIAQQGMVENSFLVGAGTVLGLLLGAYGVEWILSLIPLENPAFADVGLSGAVIIGAAGAAFVLVAVLSILPAVRCHAAISELRGARDGRGGRKERRLQTAFVTTQVALSFVLLVGASLMLQSTTNLSRLDLGFETEDLLTVRVAAPPSATAALEDRAIFTRQVISALGAVSGVEGAGATVWIPFVDGDVGFNYSVEDFPPEEVGERKIHPGRVVGAGYFASMGIDILNGRDFAASDDSEAPRVAVVSRAFESMYWPDGDALGKRIKRGAYDAPGPWFEIVGVVADARSGTISDPIRPNIYYSHGQIPGAFADDMAYTLRVSSGVDVIPAVRSAVRDVSGAATLHSIARGDEITRVAMGRSRFNTLVIGLFAIIGLVLAASGVYGVTSYGVGRRTREFGLRAALGAQPRQVLRMVLRGAVVIASIGIGVGGVGAAFLSRSLTELLYEVDVGDLSTYAAVVAVLALTVVIATFVPARRATRVDPTVALRNEA